MIDREPDALGKEVAKNTRKYIEDKIGKLVITKDNVLINI